MDQNPPGNDQRSEPETGSPGQRPRRFRATQLRPRIEVGRPKPPPEAPRQDPLVPEVVEPETGAPYGVGGRADPLGPRTFAGGRVRVYGCSPGCLVTSLLVSLFLTLLLNALF